MLRQGLSRNMCGVGAFLKPAPTKHTLSSLFPVSRTTLTHVLRPIRTLPSHRSFTSSQILFEKHRQPPSEYIKTQHYPVKEQLATLIHQADTQDITYEDPWLGLGFGHNWHSLRHLRRSLDATKRHWKNTCQDIALKVTELEDTVDRLERASFFVAQISSHYDFDKDNPGNGFRSLMTVCDRFAYSHGTAIARKCREAVGEKKKDSKVHEENLAFLTQTNEHLSKFTSLIEFCKPLAIHGNGTSLFADIPGKDEALTQVLGMGKQVFYGHMFGLHYDLRIRLIMEAFVMATASYSMAYREHDVWYLRDARAAIEMVDLAFRKGADKRAEIVCEQFASGDANFTKYFWNKSETTFVRYLPALVAPAVSVNAILRLPPIPLSFTNEETGKTVTVHPPKGVASIKVRLISKDPLGGPLGKQLQEMSKGTGGIFTSDVEVGVGETALATGTVEKQEGKAQKVGGGGGALDLVTSTLGGVTSTLGDVLRSDIVTSTVGGVSGVIRAIRPASKPVQHPPGPHVSSIAANENGNENGTGGAVMNGESTAHASPPRKRRGFLLHIHGGGFVAQTSASHLTYLRFWADTLGLPILSVDYSLAPEAPFPTALEECTYAYAWALQNAETFGTSAECVAISGESAGGNLTMATALRLGQLGIRRPDAIQCLYPALHVRMSPSPSRLLATFDALLPLGVLQTCLNAYAPKTTPRPSTPQAVSSLYKGDMVETHVDPNKTPIHGNSTKSTNQNGSGNDISRESSVEVGVTTERDSSYEEDSPPDPFVSPWHAPDELLHNLPDVYMSACELDPLLDDAVDFARRLKRMGKNVRFRVHQDTPHGFVAMMSASPAIERAVTSTTNDLVDMFRKVQDSDKRP